MNLELGTMSYERTRNILLLIAVIGVSYAIALNIPNVFGLVYGSNEFLECERSDGGQNIKVLAVSGSKSLELDPLTIVCLSEPLSIPYENWRIIGIVLNYEDGVNANGIIYDELPYVDDLPESIETIIEEEDPAYYTVKTTLSNNPTVLSIEEDLRD